SLEERVRSAGTERVSRIDDEDFVAPFVWTKAGARKNLTNLLDADQLALAADFDEMHVGMNPPLDPLTCEAVVACRPIGAIQCLGDPHRCIAQSLRRRTVQDHC